MQQSLFLIKPDGVSRGLVSEIETLLKSNGITIEEKIAHSSPGINIWREHYIEHEGKGFYEELCSEMADKPVLAMKVSTCSEKPCWQICREILGATDPKKAEPGTIRFRYGTSVRQNVAHASDSTESAERELKLWGLM